jgi:hypothetical protein
VKWAASSALRSIAVSETVGPWLPHLPPLVLPIVDAGVGQTHLDLLEKPDARVSPSSVLSGVTLSA